MVRLKVKELTSLKSKTIGLLGNDKAEAVIFKTRWGIHTFGLKFPIDVLILDKNNKVAVLKRNLKQNRIFLWPVKYETVIELPQGEISRQNLKLNTKIEYD